MRYLCQHRDNIDPIDGPGPGDCPACCTAYHARIAPITERLSRQFPVGSRVAWRKAKKLCAGTVTEIAGGCVIATMDSPTYLSRDRADDGGGIAGEKLREIVLCERDIISPNARG